MAVLNIQPQELSRWLADRSRPDPVLLDVREAWEFEVCRLPGSLHIPMQALPSGLDRLDRHDDIVVICHHGARSMQVASWLDSRGYSKVHNLAGGVDAWARQVEHSMAVY